MTVLGSGVALLVFSVAATDAAASDVAVSIPVASQEEPAVEAEAAASISSDDEEPIGPIVARIHWSGVEAFGEDDIEDRILTSARSRWDLRFWRPKPRLDEFVLEEDVDRIVEAYREIGYFSASAIATVSEIDADHVVVEFDVVEGPRVRLKAWSLEILSPPAEDDPPTPTELATLQKRVASTPDEPFGSLLYRERRTALLEECGNLGFPSARIAGGASVDLETHSATVAWTLDLGPRTYIGSIAITGLETIDQKIVRRELRFKSGDRFSTAKIRASERELVNTELFRSVTVGRLANHDPPAIPRTEPETDSAAPDADAVADTKLDDSKDATERDRIDLEVRIEEAKPRSLRVSIGYGTEEGPRGEVEITWRNFMGEARRLRVRAFASFLDEGIEASLGQPYVFGKLARGDIAISALRQSRPGYEAFVTGASGFLTFYPDREGPWSVSVGPGYELAHVLDFEIDVPESLRGPRQSVIVNWFTVARYQEVDDLINPRRGLRVELTNEFGGYPIGSDLDYQLWKLSVRGYLPTGPLVWAARASATTLDPIGQGFSFVPVTRRLYAGGTNSVRGFGYEKLGPTDSGNDPIGGLSRMELGVELRVPIWKRIGVVGFVDAGDVREGTWSWKPKDLRYSAGPGLRIKTPVGPLRFDVGFLLNAPPEVDPWRFHLSVGQAF
jgi:outer membrane protein insertion porin family/translocation and assembly module TamA